ncbi:MAG: 1-(5-phosphoribosyl)-5-[(5-phosphoribosylamino)methylideneamino]imidazole-4-carboxamide isomerase [Halobacteriota archaeon]
MEVIPAIDVRNGTCVQLVGGEPGTGASYGDPLDAVDRWERDGARRLHVVDLDAAMGTGDNRATIEHLLEAASVPVHVGGGIREADDARSLVDAGADRVVLGTVAVTDPEAVDAVTSAIGPESVLIALEPTGDGLAVEGWTGAVEADLLEVARHFDDRGVGGFLFTNVALEGRLSGIDPEPIAELVDAVAAPVYAAGGVASLDDVAAAAAAGAAGAVVGTALYSGAFSLRAAMEEAR